MITFERNNIKFNFRAAGAAVYDNRVLLHTTLKDDFWTLPGGRVELGESTDQTIIRELKEELDVEVRATELLFVSEDFFEYDNKQYHEIGFYYAMEFPQGHELVHREDEFRGIEEDGKLIFKWIPIEQLDEIQVYPERLKTELLKLKSSFAHQVQHFIDRQ